MKMNSRIILTVTITAFVSSFFFLTFCSGTEFECSTSEKVYMVGDREVRVLEHVCGNSGITVFNMHDNENTAVDAALRVIRKRGGRLVELRHSGERLISFRLGTESYKVDPNRIFTGQGLKNTLEKYSSYSHPAFDAVRAFAADILKDYRLDEAGIIVTAHNNGKGAYSAASYLPGADYETDAAEVFVAEGSDPDDFFFVTSEPAFNRLKDSGFNAVLQDNDLVTDDGSLSVLAGRKGIPYINCEAAMGHLDEQILMLEFVWALAD